jgi:hypothetical protein
VECLLFNLVLPGPLDRRSYPRLQPKSSNTHSRRTTTPGNTRQHDSFCKLTTIPPALETTTTTTTTTTYDHDHDLRPRPRPGLLRLRLRLQRHIHSSTSSDPSDARRGGRLAPSLNNPFLRCIRSAFDTSTAAPPATRLTHGVEQWLASFSTTLFLRCIRSAFRHIHSSTSSDPSDARRGGWLASFIPQEGIATPTRNSAFDGFHGSGRTGGREDFMVYGSGSRRPCDTTCFFAFFVAEVPLFVIS